LAENTQITVMIWTDEVVAPNVNRWRFLVLYMLREKTSSLFPLMLMFLR